MKPTLSAHYERELAWLRTIQAHVTRLGLYNTAERVIEMRKRVQERWACDVFRFGG
jgi:hypothetical protein